MLGIDPGLTATGWGIVSLDGHRLVHHAHGVIKTTPRQSDPHRLKLLGDGLSGVIAEYQPDAASIEDIFMNNNARSALRLGMARGVAIYETARHTLPLTEISARAVKQAVVGSGAADKEQIAYMVSRILAISITAGDSADALAIAISGLHGTGVPLALKNAGTRAAKKDKFSANPALASAIEAALEKQKD
jgi:crossover junction endodeoxyribonuclease RuvC